MRIHEDVSICNIRVDRKLPINRKTLSLIDHLRNGGVMKPVKLQPLPNLKGQFSLKNGRHRLVAAKMLGWTTIPAKYSTKMNRKVH